MDASHGLVEILLLLIAAVLVVPVFLRLGLGSVLGYLAAGALIGPWGLGLIGDVEDIRHIAEFGVVFLLFVIGVELKPARLWAMRRQVFGLGTAQVVITAGLIMAVVWLFGIDLRTTVIIGFGLALSSTAFGLQILNERGELGSPHGRVAFSILLLQDLAVVPLLALVSLLADDTGLARGLEFAVLDAVLAVGAVILVGRFLLTPLLQAVASSRTRELFIAAALVAVLGTAWLMEKAGLSLALGAFLAGLMLAESHYRHQVIADIEPFRGILLGLFFMSVGMGVDLGLLLEEALLVSGLVIGLMALKAAVLWSLVRLSGEGTANATRVAGLLSQSGEFGFVLFGLASVSGLLEGRLFQLLTLVIALTMALTPLAVLISERLSRRLHGDEPTHDVSTAHIESDQPHIIIAGFGRVGRRIARLLHRGGVPFLAIERDTVRVMEGRREGLPVFFGDASHVDVLHAAGIDRARLLVCSLDQPLAAIRLVRQLHENHPDLPIHARGRDRLHCDELRKAGATEVVSETLEASLQLGSGVLRSAGLPEDTIEELVEGLRREYYA